MEDLYNKIGEAFVRTVSDPVLAVLAGLVLIIFIIQTSTILAVAVCLKQPSSFIREPQKRINFNKEKLLHCRYPICNCKRVSRSHSESEESSDCEQPLLYGFPDYGGGGDFQGFKVNIVMLN